MADFAIEFRIKAAASGWNTASLKSAYFDVLNESIKDELATLDEPATLEELISLTIHLDSRIRSRAKERNRRDTPVRVSAASLPLRSDSAPPGSSEPEPMQIGRTHLTPQERHKRMTSRLCLYCGLPGHFIAHCPERLNPQVRQ